MKKRNPFEIVERVGNISVTVVLCVVVGLCLLLVGAFAIDSWGWWSLLAVPVIPALILLSGLLHGLAYAAAYWWRRAKRRWDETHRSE